jgi:hypothetical protein
MRLPELEEQGLYLDIGWTIVVAALGLAILGRLGRRFGWRLGRPACWVLFVLTGAAMWLPAPYAPSFWLGMAFQHPSVLLVVLAGIHLLRCLRERQAAPLPLLPPIPAVTLALLGVFLYAGVFAWIPLDPYALGYGEFAGAAIASVLAAAWYAADRRNALAGAALALAAMFHAFTRLPSGNAWDALLDPLLFLWAGGMALLALFRLLRRGRPVDSDHAAVASGGRS